MEELERILREFIPHSASYCIPDLISALKDLFRKCVPGETRHGMVGVTKEQSVGEEYIAGFNECRSQILKNIDGERTER